MGVGKTGMPRDPWDSHGNGNTISHGNGNGMGMGTRCMGMGIKTWEWEKNSPHTVTIASCAIHRNSWAVNGSQSMRKLYTLARQVLCVIE